MKVELREASIYDGLDILEMIREIGPGENGFGNSDYAMSDADFPQYLARNIDMAAGRNLRPEHVPQTKYWLCVDGRPVGIGKMRHYLKCSESNTASRRVIENNGGVLEKIDEHSCHYWIDVMPSIVAERTE